MTFARGGIWANSRNWPNDLSGGGYVFVCRALEALGQQMFNSEWTGQEFGLIPPPQTIERDAEGMIALAEAHVVRRLLPRKVPAHLIGTAPSARGTFGISDEELLAANELLRERRVAYIEAVDRRDRLEREFVAAAEAGRLQTYYSTPKGERILIDATWWATDPNVWRSRFEQGRINHRAPHNPWIALSRDGGDISPWIYVGRDSIERWRDHASASLPIRAVRSGSNYTDWERLLWAARELAAKGRKLSERGLAAMFADEELGTNADRELRRKRVDAIRSRLKEKVGKRDYERLRGAMDENP